MKIHRKDRSIRKQLIHTITLSTCCIILLSICYVIFSLNLVKTKENDHLNQRLSQTIQEIEQLTLNFSSYANLISNNSYTQQYLSETAPLSIYQHFKILDNMFSQEIESNPKITSIILVNTNGAITGFNQKMTPLTESLIQDYNLLDPTYALTAFCDYVIDPRTQKEYAAYIFPVFNTNFKSAPVTRIASCIVLTPLSIINDILTSVSAYPGARYQLSNKEGNMITESKNATYTGAFNKLGYLTKIYDFPISGWNIIYQIPYSQLYKEFYVFALFTILMLMFFTALFVFQYFSIISSILNPLGKISKFVKSGTDHLLNRRIEVNDSEEFNTLCTYINQLLDETFEMNQMLLKNQENMYKLTLAKKQAEYSALQSQINPHFLYNTLNTISGYGYQAQCMEIVKMTSSLSSILRYSIKGPDIVPVSQEINCIKQYLTIIDIRFQHRFSTTIEIPDEILSCQMPRFLLQPLVENSVYHGLEPLCSKGTLLITASIDGDFIHFVITDNGVGMNKEQLTALLQSLSDSTSLTISNSESHGIGMINLHQRIRAMYGEHCGLTIKSKENEGTTVTITIKKSTNPL